MLVYQRVSMFIPFMIPSFTEFIGIPRVTLPGAGVRNHPQDSSPTFHLLEANFGATEARFCQV